MVDYLGTKNITLINRTDEKATLLAEELGLQSAPLEDLICHIAACCVTIITL